MKIETLGMRTVSDRTNAYHEIELIVDGRKTVLPVTNQALAVLGYFAGPPMGPSREEQVHLAEAYIGRLRDEDIHGEVLPRLEVEDCDGLPSRNANAIT